MPTKSRQINQRHAPSATTMQVASTRKVVQPFRATEHQHASRQHDYVGSNVPACTSNHARHLNNVHKKSEDCRDDLFKFKARPVDRKVLASKGDVGLFRSAKRNTTVPKEFNLSTSRKGNPAPLSELFNKLSLTAGAHRGIDRQNSGLPNYITTKDCKENMIGNMQQC
uniref:TPX2 central domain-containing protein n=1 Tax=Arundo donax TaxID=35708 RepID=A0A0A9C0C7_ARUDO